MSFINEISHLTKWHLWGVVHLFYRPELHKPNEIFFTCSWDRRYIFLGVVLMTVLTPHLHRRTLREVKRLIVQTDTHTNSRMADHMCAMLPCFWEATRDMSQLNQESSRRTLPGESAAGNENESRPLLAQAGLRKGLCWPEGRYGSARLGSWKYDWPLKTTGMTKGAIKKSPPYNCLKSQDLCNQVPANKGSATPTLIDSK